MIQRLALLGPAEVVHEDLIAHGELHDGDSLWFVRDPTGVLDVEAHKFLLLLLEPLLVHGDDSLHGLRRVGVHHLRHGGAMGSDFVGLRCQFLVIHGLQRGNGPDEKERARKKREMNVQEECDR